MNDVQETELATTKPVKAAKPQKKSLGATDSKDTATLGDDLVVWGEGDVFKLISKTSSTLQGWMKSTKAMQVPGGCVVQVSTQQGDHVAEAVTFVPNVEILERCVDGRVVSRSLVAPRV